MNILSIGNSFSKDAQRYLHGIAKADGVTLECFNLYIGGCSLEKHYRNMMGDFKAYTLEMNGQSTGFSVSIKDALLNRAWDVVTVQQASHFSPFLDTYTPYIEKLAEYVRLYCPKASLVVHKTWAYADGGDKLTGVNFPTHEAMYNTLSEAYDKAAELINADVVIPSGTVFNRLNKEGLNVHRADGFHAGYGIGRYALGLAWYKKLTGNDVTENVFRDFDEPIDEATVALIKKCVTEMVK